MASGLIKGGAYALLTFVATTELYTAASGRWDAAQRAQGHEVSTSVFNGFDITDGQPGAFIDDHLDKGREFGQFAGAVGNVLFKGGTMQGEANKDTAIALAEGILSVTAFALGGYTTKRVLEPPKVRV